jgi:hypothetical protein
MRLRGNKMVLTVYQRACATNRPSSRPVIDENGVLYPCALAAAEARGVSATAAYMRARFRRSGWKFASPAEIAAAAELAKSDEG